MSGIDNIIDTVNAHMVVNRADTWGPRELTENVFAKITKPGSGGFYEAKEIVWNEDAGDWETDDDGLRVWGPNDVKLLEINFSEDVAKDTIVAVTPAPAPQGLWVFSVAAAPGGGGSQVTKSNTTGSGFLRDENGDLIPSPNGGFQFAGSGLIQFHNDVFFNAPADKLGVPDILGSRQSGIRIYSGQEEVDPATGKGGRQRNYNWLWRGKNNRKAPSSEHDAGAFGDLLLSIIVPQSDLSSGQNDSGDLAGTNVRHIKFLRFNNGHTVEIYHSRLPKYSNLSTALKAAYIFPVNGGTMWVSKTNGGTTDMPVLVDYLGHIWEMDSSYGGDTPPTDDDDDPTGDFEIVLEMDQADYDNAASLYNPEMTQTTSFEDGAGVGTNNEVGELNLIYIAEDSNGVQMDIGETVKNPRNQAVIVDSTADEVVVGTGGNVDNLVWNFTRVLNGSNVTMQAQHSELFIFSNKVSIETDGVYGEFKTYAAGTTTPEITTITKSTNFDIWIYYLLGAGGAQWDRENGNNSYEIRLTIMDEDDNLLTESIDFNITGPLTGTLDSFDTATKSGFLFEDINITWTDTKYDGSTIKICADLYFVNANGAIASQYGICELLNQGDTCTTYTLSGTSAVGTIVTPAAGSTYSSEILIEANESVTAADECVELRGPIDVKYTISKGGNTLEWVGDPAIVEIQNSAGDKMFFSFLGDSGVCRQEQVVTMWKVDSTSGFEKSILRLGMAEFTKEELLNTQGILDDTYILIVKDVAGVPISKVKFFIGTNYIPSGLTAYYDFEGTYTTAAGIAWDDKLGSSNLVATSSDFTKNAESNVDGRSGQHLSIDVIGGTGNNWNAGNFASGLVQPYTITMWWRPTAFAGGLGTNTILGAYPRVYNSGGQIQWNTAGNWSETFSVNNWYFIAITHASNNVNLWFGDMTNPPSLNATTVSSTSLPTSIGTGGSSSGNLKGQLDDLRTFGSVLSELDINSVWSYDK